MAECVTVLSRPLLNDEPPVHTNRHGGILLPSYVVSVLSQYMAPWPAHKSCPEGPMRRVHAGSVREVLSNALPAWVRMTLSKAALLLYTPRKRPFSFRPDIHHHERTAEQGGAPR